MPPDPNRSFFLDLVERRSDINGRFVNIRRIDPNGGDGFFSIVFKATDSTTKNEVALKIFHPDRLSDAYRSSCFEREAELLERLSGQPDIIQSLSPLSRFNEQLKTMGLLYNLEFRYYAVELAVSNVRTVIENDKWDAMARLYGFRAMCRAVQRMHNANIVHRDLKPSNFLIMKDGSVKLADLGTARSLDSTISPLRASYPSAPGDLRYSSPELLAGLLDEDPSLAIHGDYFSLGAILFELFSGCVLGTELFDRQFIIDLAQVIAATKAGQRQRIFCEIIKTIAISHPLPELEYYSTGVPNCIRDHLNNLYRSLATLDYRTRLCDFRRIFRLIDICLIVLRNEKEYARWMAERTKRRQVRYLKKLELTRD
jgi:serine/threonine protein kinase